MKRNSLLKISAIALLLPVHVSAIETDPLAGLATAGEGTSLLKSSPNDIVTGVINAVLSLLGSIFLALIVYGGFKWMTSRGNAEAVGEAKKVITSSVIGLVIVVTAYAITYAVISLLQAETGAGGAVNCCPEVGPPTADCVPCNN